MRRRFFFYAWTATILVAVSIWGFFIEPSMLNHQTISVSGPSPLKIAIASDLHAGSPSIDETYVNKLVDKVLASQPDLILLPGDFIDHSWRGRRMSPERIASLLQRLQAPHGVWAVLGNHDWWEGGFTWETNRMRIALQDAGIRILENDAKPLEGTPYWLVGIGDHMTAKDNPQKAVEKAPDHVPLIIMMHDPRSVYRLLSKRNTTVAVAGHTHGGQIRLPFLGPLMASRPLSRNNMLGWMNDAPVPTYVTAGIGTSILPLRIGIPPEWVSLKIQ